MREYPWISRQINWTQANSFGLLYRQWALTRRWVSELGLPIATLQRKGLTQGLDPIAPVLAYWEKSSGVPDPIVTDWSMGAMNPSECLMLLHQAIRVQQALVVDQVLRKSGDSRSTLIEICRSAGRDAGGCSSERDAVQRGGSLLSNAYAALLMARMRRSHVVERQCDGRIDWMDAECPHLDPLLEVGPVADVLCDLNAAWQAGFVEGLSAGLELSRISRKNCRFRLELSE